MVVTMTSSKKQSGNRANGRGPNAGDIQTVLASLDSVAKGVLELESELTRAVTNKKSGAYTLRVHLNEGAVSKVMYYQEHTVK